MTYGHEFTECRAIANRKHEGPQNGARTVWSQCSYQQSLLSIMTAYLLLSTITLKGFAHLQS